jgi:chromosomal replication initiator protein
MSDPTLTDDIRAHALPSSDLDLWERALLNARRRSPASFDQWFSGVQFEGFAQGVLGLTARDEFVRDWIKAHFIPAILGDLEQLLESEQLLNSTALEARPPRLQVSWRVSTDISKPIGLPRTPPTDPFRWSPDPLALTQRCAARSDATATGNTQTTLTSSHTVPSSAKVDPRERGAAGKSSDTPSSLSTQARDAVMTKLHPVPGVAELETRAAMDSDRDIGPGLKPKTALFRAGDPINPKHTFPNFVVGPSNELAYAASMASSGSERPRYNPLFICGGTGLGKTHLVHSIAHRLLETRPGRRVLYLSAERFTNEFIEALQHHRMEEFRTRYRRQCDALLVDDIQFLAGREQTQEEFFHTFNALRDLDRPIVVTSDKYPQDLQRMPERLISRFTSGLVADVQTPALETRVAILRKKAALEGIPLDDNVAVLLAQQIKSNVRELEGTLIRLAAKSSLLGCAIDLAFAASELNAVNPSKLELTTVEDIQRVVCGHFSLTSTELLSKNRHKSVAFARQVAMYLCRQRLNCSFPELGRAFGNRDHTTVISACRRVETLRQQDPQVNAHLQALESKLTAAG